MGRSNKLGRLSAANKKKLLIVAAVIGLVVLLIVLLIGALVVALISAVFSQADSNVVQGAGGIVSNLWNYVVQFIDALWQQVIADPLKIITGGNG